jgi:benzodiazapine receptor
MNISREANSNLMDQDAVEVKYEDNSSNYPELRTAPLWLRICAFILFIGCLVVNGVIGVAGPNSAGAVSEIYELWVTPPGYTFSIWGVIYIWIGIASLYAAIKNTWSVRSWLIFTLVNVANSLWIGLWSLATHTSIIICLIIITILPIGLLWLWYSLYQPEIDDWKYYLTRNAVAFYLGWTIAATFLNLGAVLVYVGGVSQRSYTIAFWIVVPLVAIIATIVNIKLQGMNGFKSCFCVWLSVLWALGNALVTTLTYKELL